MCFRPASMACTADIATTSQTTCIIPGGASTSQRWCWESWKPIPSWHTSTLLGKGEMTQHHQITFFEVFGTTMAVSILAFPMLCIRHSLTSMLHNICLRLGEINSSRGIDRQPKLARHHGVRSSIKHKRRGLYRLLPTVVECKGSQRSQLRPHSHMCVAVWGSPQHRLCRRREDCCNSVHSAPDRW
jgi:hypothetical protein